MKCKVCGSESGQYPLCRACNAKKERGEIIKCEKCKNWHYASQPCMVPTPVTNNEKYLYEVKKTLISKSEQSFYKVLKEVVPEGYYIFPQINLATFINRTDDARFQNELYRNVDFLITDEQYQPKIVVEINDQSHLTAERRERDEKVHNICEEAGIPIVKLWTSYGINSEYIKGKIEETLNRLPVARVHHFNKVPAQRPVKPVVVRQTYSPPVEPQKGGCYIATCVYGSYDCPQVWILRRYRDFALAKSFFGRAFIKFYYRVSPVLVRVFGRQNWFRRICSIPLSRLVTKLQKSGYEDTPYND